MLSLSENFIPAPKTLIGGSALLIFAAAIFGVLNVAKVKTLRSTAADASTARVIAEQDRASGYVMESLTAAIAQGNDEAKKRVEILLKQLGYSVIDLGNLRDGGLIQQAGGPLAGRNLLEQGGRHK